MTLIIHAVSRDSVLGTRSLCGVPIDGRTATGHYPPIEPVGDKPACVACMRLERQEIST